MVVTLVESLSGGTDFLSILEPETKKPAGLVGGLAAGLMGGLLGGMGTGADALRGGLCMGSGAGKVKEWLVAYRLKFSGRTVSLPR